MSSNYTETAIQVSTIQNSENQDSRVLKSRSWLLSLGLCCLLSLSFGLSGCASKPLKAPASAYQSLAEQNYEFQTVWEVSIETMKVLGFQVKDKTRDGGESNAEIRTGLKITQRVAFFGTESAESLTLQISPGAKPNQYSLKLAAIEWTREVTKNGTQLWKYKGPKKELVSAFEKELESRFSARYKGKNR